MCHFNNKLAGMTNDQTVNFLQTYSLKKGLKQFGACSKIAAHKEMKQLHDRAVFEAIRLEEMTQLERKRALESLIFLVEKRDGRVKAQTCANGSTQREYITQEEAEQQYGSEETSHVTMVCRKRHDYLV